MLALGVAGAGVVDGVAVGVVDVETTVVADAEVEPDGTDGARRTMMRLCCFPPS